MAIATLDAVYNNEQVFTGVVKIRKGTAAKLILNSGTLSDLHFWFHHYAVRIRNRVPPLDPNATQTIQICTLIIEHTGDGARQVVVDGVASTLGMLSPLAVAWGALQLRYSRTFVHKGFGVESFSLTDALYMTLCFGGALYSVGYLGLRLAFAHIGI